MGMMPGYVFQDMSPTTKVCRICFLKDTSIMLFLTVYLALNDPALD